MDPATPDSMPIWLVPAIVVGFLVVFPLFWCFVVWLVSRIGGWNRLAKRYPAGDRPVTGTRVSSITGMVGVSSYRHTLTLHFTPGGFFMEVMPLFRIGHPRLFISWSEISGRRPANRFFWKIDRLDVGNPKVGVITLPSDLVEAHYP